MAPDTLKLFLHLSRTLHFGKTSQDCYLSPSTLSRIIKKLEEQIGYPLFIRNNRKVTLTPEGVKFQQYATKTLAEWDAFQSTLNDDHQQLHGEISLFCSVTACYSILPKLLNRFRESFPDIHIKLEIGNSINALKKIKDGSVDVIVAALPDTVSDDLQARTIIVTPLVFVAPTASCAVSSLVDRQKVSWSELPMILPQTGLARNYTNQWFKERKITPSIYSQVVGNEAILALVSLGCGVGIVPQLVLDKSPLKSEVRVLPVDTELPELKVGVCLQKKKLHSPLINAYWNSIQT